MHKWGKTSRLSIGLIGAMATLAFFGATTTSRAQFVCDSADAGEDGQGATAAGNAGNLACGLRADASGNFGSNTASGVDSRAFGANSGNTALGANSAAFGNNSRNTASGNFANASGEISVNTANGVRSDASGNRSANTASGNAASASGNNSLNTATGTLSNATGSTSSNSASGSLANSSGNFSKNTANGFDSNASGNMSTNVAIGASALATGDDTSNTAVGARATATGANSSAFGAGARAARDNQMAFGTSANTYTMVGIASSASRAAQSGPLQIVTTDRNGNLASDGGAFQARIDALGSRDRELAEGIAVSLAIQQPIFHSGQSFAFRMGYGNFDGSNALGLSSAGDRDTFGRGSSVTLDAGLGIGTDKGTVAGRTGITIGW